MYNERATRIILILGVLLSIVVLFPRVQAHSWSKRQPVAQGKASQVAIDADDLGGVVTSAKGPEAGVWVIAETTELPTKFRKIVVTDDQGRYLIPQMPIKHYKIWVRGYGLVDSQPVEAMPGKNLYLTAVIAPSAEVAAQYYPAAYWYSLAQVPPKTDFPGTGPQGNGIDPRMKTQADWIWQMKAGCETCHQIGDKATRQIEPQLGTFSSTLEAWDHRVRVGQDGAGMSGSMDRYGRPRGLGMLADWTDRIAKGELPPVPPRPQGVERNVVITEWEWGFAASFPHDELTTDKRHPTANAYGTIYGADWGNDDLLMVDPVEGTATHVRIPVREEGVPPGKTQSMMEPSPYWGNQLYWYDPIKANNLAIDSEGRIWMPAQFRKAENQPAFCKQGSSLPWAQMYPIDHGPRQMEYYDPKTKKFTFVDTCFDNHHVTISDDEVVYGSGPFTGAIGWVDIKTWDQTHDPEKSQGWCGGYFDINGNGKFDPDTDKKVVAFGEYGISASPKDNSAWSAIPGVPGRIMRIDRKTCVTEVYEPPYNNPDAPGRLGFGPRGIDVDTNGIVWTALAGSSHLASFDRTKCQVKSGPAITNGQHCPEGWTLYPTPGPTFKGTDFRVDYHYFNWVDRYNTSGLGDNTPFVNGTTSDSLLALTPSTGKFITLRVPYPMGFYQRGMDGRIDDPKGGWKGRGIYADYGPNAAWHIEPVGTTARSSVVKFQIRPSPLAK